jgi:glyoxylase-like metal-dependent hydrolase (beta-lactamase superfamily II)
MKSRVHLIVAILAITCSAYAAQSSKAKPPGSLRLYVFDCGMLDIPDTTNYQLKKEELATAKMAVTCYLIAHPKGTLIWDVGAVPDSSFKPDGSHTPLRYAHATKTLTSQLAAIGYAPGDITYLSFSHFHWDHVGNANLFARTATWLVRKLEREMMFGDTPSTRTEPANFSLLKNAKTVIVTRDEHDVFGDGTVVLKSTPGHSPDHQVLFLKLAKTGPILLSGDLYHYPEERKLNKVPTSEFNVAQTVASRAAVDAFLKKTGAQLWIQHEFTADANLKKSPQYYE